ncbi:MAG: branched-chain amino acid ABC transporter permease [Rhodospirillales bacterium]|nr:branched-chain amino acid ABC transporter permease [Rhodospirillales bacterium]MDE2200981.1 branched-chain amino acid ABC transporter permease [Rhodospirillales bacterium]
MKLRVVYGLILLLAILPWFIGSRYIFHIATMIVIMIPLVLGMHLMVRIGQLSLAHPAFWGVGAYASALLTMRLGMPPLLSILVGALIPSLMALVLGPIFLRIKGVFFVLLTFAFGEIVDLVFQEWTDLFGGNSGLYGIPKFSILGLRLTQIPHYYVLGLIAAVLIYLLMRAIERSDIGAILESLNEDEMLSRSMGANALAWRVAAFVVSAFVAGISGGIYAFYIGFLSPDPFGFQTIVDLIVMVTVGGAGTVLGPVLGAIVTVPLPELLRDAREYQLMIYGVCLIGFMKFAKQGLISFIVDKRSGA